MPKELLLVGKFEDKISPSLKRINQTLAQVKKITTQVNAQLDQIEKRLKALRKTSAQSAKDYQKMSTSLRQASKSARSLNSELKVSQSLYSKLSQSSRKGVGQLGKSFSGAFTGAIAGMSVGSAIGSVKNALFSDVQNFISTIQSTFNKSTNFIRGQIGKGASLQMETISSANTIFTTADTVKTFDDAMKVSSDSIAKMAGLAAALPGATQDYVTIFNGVLDDQIGMFGSVEGVLKNVDEKGKQSFTALLGLAGQMNSIRPEMLLMDMNQFRQGQSIRNIQFISRNPLLQKKLTEAYASMLGMTVEAYEKLSPTKSAAIMKTLGEDQRMEALYEALQTSISKEAVMAMENSWSGVTEGLKSVILDPSSGIFGLGRRLKDGQTVIGKLSLALKEFSKPVIKIVETIIGSSLDPLELLGKVLTEFRYRAILFGYKFEDSMKSIFGSLDPAKIREQLGEQAGRMKFAELIGRSLAELVNGVANMVTAVLNGGGKGSVIGETLTKFIDTVKANLDYNAINEALGHLVKAGAALLVEYSGMRAKFIQETATAAARGAGIPASGLIGEATSLTKAPLGFVRNEIADFKSMQRIKELTRGTGVMGGQLTTAAMKGDTDAINRYREILLKTERGRAALVELEKYLSDKKMRSDFEGALHDSGLFDGSPPYLRTMAYDQLPALIHETKKGNSSLKAEVAKINAGIKAMAAVSGAGVGGGGGSAKPSGSKDIDGLKANLLKVFGDRDMSAAIFGNLMQESGGDSGISNPKSGNFGLAQWGGSRLTALNAFAQAQGTTASDQMTQIKFILHELQTTESAAYEKVKEALATGGVPAATRAFAKYYERMGAHEENAPNRLAQAASFAGGNMDPLNQELKNKPAGSNIADANDSELSANKAQTKMLAHALNGKGGDHYHIQITSAGSSPEAIAQSVINGINQLLGNQSAVAV